MRRDIGATAWVVEHVPEWSISLFSMISYLGDLLVIGAVIGAVYCFDLARSIRSAPRNGSLCSDRSAFLVATVLGGLALIVVLETVFSLPRTPTEWHMVSASPYGFPSGHAMAATVCWGGLAWWYREGARWIRFLGAGTVVGIVGISRIALGLHYLVDVLAAIGLGLVFLVLFMKFVADRPDRAFVGAIAIAGVAVVVSGAGSRSLVALGGTVGVTLGWRIVELEPVRQRIVSLFGGTGTPTK